MKGIIFNLLEEVLVRAQGEEGWDTVLQAAGLDGVYTSLGSYPDDDLTKLVHASSRALGRPEQDILHLFGVEAIPLLATKYPVFFDGHSSTRSFLLTLNDIIHPEVRKLYPGADVPDFSFEGTSEDVLVMVYVSARKLCCLAEGFIQGAAHHYGEKAVIKQTECMNRRDLRCVLRISFFSEA